MRKLGFLALIAMVSSVSCWADLVVSVGAGKRILSQGPFERVAAVGYQRSLIRGLFVRPELGGWTDLSGNGKSSPYLTAILGIRALPNQTGPEVHIGVGPSFLLFPDQVLGGHFQFSLEGGIGLVDHDVYLGIAYKHLSSAGIEMPNQGRDLVVVQMRVLAF